MPKIILDIKEITPMETKKVLRPTLIGFALLLVSLILTGIVGVTDLINGGSAELYGHTFNYGFANSLTNYWLIWRPGLLGHEVAYVGQVLFFVAITLTLTLIIMSIVKKKPIFILPALVMGAGIAYLPFLLILAVPMAQLGVLRAAAMALLSGVTGLVLFSIYFEILATKNMLKDSMKLLDKAAGDEPKEEKPAEQVAGLSEEEVRAIVEQYLKEHVDELHVPGEPVVVADPEEDEKIEPVEEPEEEPEEQPAPAEEPKEEEQPAEEPAPEEEPEEEEDEADEEEDETDEEEDEEEGEEQPADSNVPVGLNIKGKRRRASFETRLKNSEFDLRHKYYDLRDYIKWYGLRNRISIPGDTFSYKRQRYVFVTIVGKHIRVYLGLDPNDYADSTIPVEPATAKKYEDLPCLLRVKSDLSYRRAKKLVDDLMQKIGMDKPDEDEPKETQKDE